MLSEVRVINNPFPPIALQEQEPSDKVRYIQQLYSEKLFPELQSTGQPFLKASRRKYEELENSIWVDKNGNIFEQYHSKDRNGVSTGIPKGLLGEGDCKKVWMLKPLHVNSGCPEMVRARFHLERMTGTLQKRLEAFQKFKSELDSEHLLIPEMVVTINSKGEKVVYQMMPKALGDLSKFSRNLSHLGRLRAGRDAGLGLIGMHKQGCAHLHLTTANIMIMKNDRNNPEIKLCDFDMTIKSGMGVLYSWRKDAYTDPRCLRFENNGLNDAKIHDQFSFGVFLCKIFTGYLPRNLMESDDLAKDMEEKDLEVRGFHLLSDDIKKIIRACCLGNNRTYQLPEFVAVINRLIDEHSKSILSRSVNFKAH